MTAVSGRIAEFQKRDCAVLGISTDSIGTHERWLATPLAHGGMGGLQIPLASDEDGSTCRAYGVYLARQHVALRGLFIIDPNGVLQYQVVHNLSLGRSTEELLRVLDGLQSGGLCPSDWTPDDPVMDPNRTLGPNHVLGQYRIEAVLGAGGFGTVFRARDQTLERTVALKVMRRDAGLPADATLNEARAAAGLNHHNVCIIYGIDQSQGIPMIVMEYIDGQPLSELLEQSSIEPATAVSLGRQIAQGMAVAHAQGIVHGDLKPGNIMVTPTGTVKLMDFGLAHRYAPPALDGATIDWQPTVAAGLSGTPNYMAPEQVRGGPATPASDVFALGLIFYEIVTGRLAIPRGQILEVLGRIEHVDPDRYAAETVEPFAGILRQALIVDPARRTITMSQISSLLD